jgi:hypothetical protein
VESADAAVRQVVIDQLIEAEFVMAGEGETVDLMVIDVDGGGSDSTSSTKGTMTVFLSASPAATEHEIGSVVVSKFQHVAEWVSRLKFVALVVAAFVCGCGKPPAEAPRAEVAQSAGWMDQVAAVRNGAKKSIVVSGPVSSAEWQALGSGCGDLEALEVDEPAITTADFEMLLGLGSLKRLKLGRGLTDEGAAAIGMHPKIVELLVSSDVLTDEGVKSLCRLPLEQLWLQGPKVSDEGIKELGKLKSLRFLHLLDVPATDAVLPAVAEIRSLESLYLDRAKCTDEGLSTLLQERPDIHFHRDQTHLKDDPRRDGH